MTTQRHLPADLSPLWQYPDNMFVVRYLDMNEAARRKFAWCIKRWAPQRRLRINVIGAPTVEDVQSVLAEINPIVISSRNTDTDGDGRLNNSPFGRCVKMEPWSSRNLTKIIYRCLCTRKKKISIDELFYLTGTHTDASYEAEQLIRRQSGDTPILQEQTETPLVQPEDITMQKLQEINLHHNSRTSRGPSINPLQEMPDIATEELIRHYRGMNDYFTPTPQQPRPQRTLRPQLIIEDELNQAWNDPLNHN